MNQYLLLLGPALGFALGVFFTWFLTYAKLRQAEKNAAEEKLLLEEKLNEGKAAIEELAKVKNKYEESHTSNLGLKKQIEEKTARLNAEAEKRSALEERTKKIEILEKVISDLKAFEHEALSLREKSHNMETSLAEKKELLSRQQSELDTGKQELKIAQEKIEAMVERLKELAVVRERARKLEDENSNLLKENEQLRNMEAQLRQINEIKEMYSRTIEENQAFKNQDMVRHFMEIKDGLQQSIKAYNRMLEMVDNPMLDDNKMIEIEAKRSPRVKNATQAESHNAGDESDFCEEEQLEKIETDTEDLEKVDGMNA